MFGPTINSRLETKFGPCPSVAAGSEAISLWITSLCPLPEREKFRLLASKNTLERLQISVGCFGAMVRRSQEVSEVPINGDDAAVNTDMNQDDDENDDDEDDEEEEEEEAEVEEDDDDDGEMEEDRVVSNISDNGNEGVVVVQDDNEEVNNVIQTN